MLPLTDARSGYPAALAAAADLIRSLDSTALSAPTRCEGWTVASVASHIAGGLTDALNLRLDDAGTDAWTSRQVAERAGRSGSELADELAEGEKGAIGLLSGLDDTTWTAPVGGGYDGSFADGVGSMWFDVAIHADDIRSALGLRSDFSTPNLLWASVDHIGQVLATQGFGPATLALDGLPEVLVGGGGGRRITGDPVAFVLAGSGRIDPASIGLEPEINIYR